MEKVKLNEFLKIKVTNGYGYSDGCGYGCGSNFSEGSGKGCGSGYGYVHGFGSGAGFGNGAGSDYGSGYGYGYGYGSGDGYDDGIAKFENRTVSNIDEMPTVIQSIHKNIAKGYILNSDFTLEPCYVVKSDKYFAHGVTMQEALEALQEKMFDDIPVEEKINAFMDKFKLGKRYPASEFYMWHHNLTGSCKMGRDNFIANHNIDMDSQYTVEEFIELTKNDFGGRIIEQLKERYER